MAEIVFEVIGRVAIELVGAVISAAIQSHAQQRRAPKLISSFQGKTHLSSTPISSSGEHARAVLIVSSNITFGNACERLVNIAFQASQTFPKMMNTCADVSAYLRKELAKQYPDQYFHIIIGANQKFGFSVDDSQYFAEIKQDRYRVLIFTTKENFQTKCDTHDANSQMSLVWK